MIMRSDAGRLRYHEARQRETQANKTDGLKDSEKVRNKFIQTFQKWKGSRLKSIDFTLRTVALELYCLRAPNF